MLVEFLHTSYSFVGHSFLRKEPIFGRLWEEFLENVFIPANQCQLVEHLVILYPSHKHWLVAKSMLLFSSGVKWQRFVAYTLSLHLYKLLFFSTCSCAAVKQYPFACV